ncbi:TRm24 transposase, partial CDS, partial [Neorhizobium galegae bv. officinalis]
LGRHRSTIYRELKRNTFHDREFPECTGYFGTIADDMSKERRRRLRKLIRHPPIMDKIINAFSPLPSFARRSSTFRGTEFAGFRALEGGIGARSWFCDPSSPWQKGAVENANKRIRRFLLGNTDLSNITQQQLVDLGHHLNAQPRKCLGYKTPAEVFIAHLRETG